jgi:hypothetical protein
MQHQLVEHLIGVACILQVACPTTCPVCAAWATVEAQCGGNLQ